MIPRRRYSSFAPIPALVGLVESVWVQEHPPAPDAPPTTVLPAGRVELIVSYGDPFLRETPGGSEPIPQASLGGQRTRPMRVRAGGSTGLVILGFYPWAAGVLLGADARGARDGFVAVADRFGEARERRLLASVAGTLAPEVRARRVQQAIAAWLAGRTADRLAVASALRIYETLGRRSVAGVAHDLGVSRRQVQRRISECSGLGPKKLAAIVRFQRALAALGNGASPGDVARACGYADQAHLTHAVRALAGVTPAALRPRLVAPLARSFNGAGSSPTGATVYLQEASAAAPAPQMT